MELHVYVLLGLGLLANSIMIAATRHPGDDPRFWVRFLGALGRASFLRHKDSPDTLHLPLTAQPPPRAVIPGEVQTLPRPLLPPAALGAVALFLVFAVGCATAGKRAVNHELAGHKALTQELTAFSVRTESEITKGARTQEEADRTAKPFRAAVDFAFKLLERSGQSLKKVAKALGVEDRPASAGGAL